MSFQRLLCKDLKLLETGELSDATITCGETTWKVHKSIIYRCEWFKKAFGGNFREAHTNNVDISSENFAPELVDAVITFIYSGSVDIEKLNTNDSVVDACVRLWVLSDFLVFKELEQETVSILTGHCRDISRVLLTFNAALTGTAMPEDDLGDFLAQAFRGIDTAYTTYPHSLPCQQVLVTFFDAARPILFGAPLFVRAMSDAPAEFSHDLLNATLLGGEIKWLYQPRRSPLEQAEGEKRLADYLDWRQRAVR